MWGWQDYYLKRNGAQGKLLTTTWMLIVVIEVKIAVVFYPPKVPRNISRKKVYIFWFQNILSYLHEFPIMLIWHCIKQINNLEEYENCVEISMLLILVQTHTHKNRKKEKTNARKAEYQYNTSYRVRAPHGCNLIFKIN